MRTIGRLGAAVALAACAWTGADGLRRVSAAPVFARARIPWDADRLPEAASDARVLDLRPTSPFARFHDALRRAESDDGAAFRLSARAMLRWARNQPGTLLELGHAAMSRWKERGEPADREVGEALLVEFSKRAPQSETEGVRVWLLFASDRDDPFALFHDAPADRWPMFGAAVSATHPDAAWRFLLPALEAGGLDGGRYGAVVLDLARKRRQPGDAAALEAFSRRTDLAPDVAAALHAFLADAPRR